MWLHLKETHEPEKIQRVVVKMVPSLRHFTKRERLEKKSLWKRNERENSVSNFKGEMELEYVDRETVDKR